MPTNQEVSIDWSNVEEAAKLCANNHAKFKDFGWSSEPKDSERYMLFYTSNRDSGIVAKSNEKVINEELLKFHTSVWEERHNHWACGYIDGLCIRVYLKDGKTISKAFRKLCELQQRLESCVALDETDVDKQQYEAAVENIKDCGHGLVRAQAPDDWATKVYSWLWDNTSALEDPGGDGAYPSKDEIKKALQALKMLDPAESDNELDDFPVGSHVFIDECDEYSKPFGGIVISHDEYNDYLLVEDCTGLQHEVLPGEARLKTEADEDPHQYQLFYYFRDSGYVAFDEYRNMKAEAENMTHE